MRLKLISCEVFYREMAAASARSPNQIEVEFLSRGLHKNGCAGMRRRLQNAINRADRAKFQAVLLGYGLCSIGLAGLQARSIPIVIPRACDCITRLLDEKECRVGTLGMKPVFHLQSSTGMVRLRQPVATRPMPPSKKKEFTCGFDQLAAKYGPEVARYLYEEFGQHNPPAQRGGLITFFSPQNNPRHQRFGTGLPTRRRIFEAEPRKQSIIQQLVDGYWSYDKFLVIPAGWQVAIKYDEGITAEEIRQ